MTDDLRTRIAAVLYRLWQQRFPRSIPWEQLPADEREPWLTDADAVIRELQLTVLGDGIIVGAVIGEAFRYVAEWGADNE